MDFRIFYFRSNTEKNPAAAAPLLDRLLMLVLSAFIYFYADDSQVNLTLKMATSIPFNFIDTVCVAIIFFLEVN